MEQIQFIYFQYYAVHHKENSRIWKFGIVDDGLSSALNCQSVLVLLKDYCITGRANVIFCAVGLR